MTFKAVAFDLDGTLVNEKSSWYKLHKYFGTYEQSKANMVDYENGRITYDEFMRRDIRLWKPAPTRKLIENLLLNFTICNDVENIIPILRENGYSFFIVTTAPDILANAVAAKLGINNVACNGFNFGPDGFLTDKPKFNVDLLRKDKAFYKITKLSKLTCKDCIALGDSKYDIIFLRKAGLGIAYKPDEVLEKESFPIISDFKELLNFI